MFRWKTERPRHAERRGQPLTDAEALAGCWHVVRVAGDIAEGPDAEMEFRAGGDADHAVLLPDGWMVFRMNYRIEGDILILEVYSPGKSPPDRWRFSFEKDGTLLLVSGNGRAWLQRGERRAPRVIPADAASRRR